MKVNKILPESTFYGLAFLVALGLRLYQLGAAPLSEAEAGWALQALGLAHGQSVTLGSQPAYILITSQLFSILGDTNFLARFIPALAGSLLIWLPFYFRTWLGNSSILKRAGMVMAFGLAIDPGLVSLSRQAGSLMPAMAFVLLALAGLYNRRMIWAGIFAGLALLSGPAFLQGLLILGIGWGLYRLLVRKSVAAQREAGDTEHPVATAPAPSLSALSIKTGVIALGLTLLFTGSLFLRAPQGLGGVAETIPAYFKTWVTSSGIPLFRLPLSLLVYQPLVLILGLVGAIHAWFGSSDEQHSRQIMQGLSLLALMAFLLPWLYAGRQVGDLAWTVVPLWALAALEISRSLTFDDERVSNFVGVGLALLLSLFAVIGWLNFLSIGRFQVNLVVYWGIILGALLLGLIAVLLVIAGWSVRVGKLGAVLSLCLILGLHMASTTWGMAIVRQNSAQELWSLVPTTGQADLLKQTLADLSSWNTGLRDQLEVVILADSAALQWALRDFPNARYEASLSPTES